MKSLSLTSWLTYHGDNEFIKNRVKSINYELQQLAKRVDVLQENEKLTGSLSIDILSRLDYPTGTNSNQEILLLDFIKERLHAKKNKENESIILNGVQLLKTHYHTAVNSLKAVEFTEPKTNQIILFRLIFI